MAFLSFQGQCDRLVAPDLNNGAGGLPCGSDLKTSDRATLRHGAKIFLQDTPAWSCRPTRAVQAKGPRPAGPDHRVNAFRTASGARSMTSRQARGALSGWRKPCSQRRSALTPKRNRPASVSRVMPSFVHQLADGRRERRRLGYHDGRRSSREPDCCHGAERAISNVVHWTGERPRSPGPPCLARAPAIPESQRAIPLFRIPPRCGALAEASPIRP